MKSVAAITGTAVLCVAAVFGLSYLGLLWTKFTAPQYESIRRDVMIESRAFNEATARRMYDLMRQYNSAQSDAERSAIAASARHEVAGFDVSRLPFDLQAFVRQIGG